MMLGFDDDSGTNEVPSRMRMSIRKSIDLIASDLIAAPLVKYYRVWFMVAVVTSTL